MHFSMMKKILYYLTLSILLTACVTTETGGFADKKNPVKARQQTEALARYYIETGDWEMAKHHLAIALDMDDHSAGLYEVLAMVYINTGERSKADQAYRQAIQLDPAASRIRMNYASFLYDEGHYQQAAQQLQVVADDILYPKRAVALASLGRCYTELGQYDLAIDAYQRAYLIDGDNPSLLLPLAVLYFQQGDYQQSQAYYRRFAATANDTPPMAQWLAVQLSEKS